ncbi:MAG: HAMP domain-containing histidine kinase [Roseburia sp.]|nr:HAMP domain-containing histidine kinase [Roseburia sp.]MCM1098145.1 HAMP domain-containing histidine kinase [Ruminococcus flavefaciens]
MNKLQETEKTNTGAAHRKLSLRKTSENIDLPKTKPRLLQLLSDRSPLSSYGRRARRQILLQYAFSIIAYIVICCLLITLAFNGYHVYRKITHDESSLIFAFAQVVRETLMIWPFLFGVLGWIFLTRFFIGKPLRYLDELIEAAELLSTPADVPISLSPDLREVQDSLNLVRERALRNALLAKEAEQRKNDLIIYLAHDLKTPLTSVIGYLSLLRDEPEISPELRAHYTGVALEKALRLEDLINEFFDITRFNLTTLTLEPERVSLSRMLEQIVSEFLPVLAEKDLAWKTDITPGVELLCDPDKLERVFDNLIRNAVNYSYPQTKIRLTMRPARSMSGGSDEKDSVLIAVSNRGKTIPPDKLDRIFEQFFRLDSSRSSSTGGAGLGLAIAKEIVELHGGTITADSENESILFTVSLPVRNS